MDPSREGGQRTHDLVYEDVGAVERDCPVCATEDPAERLPKAVPQAEFKSFH